MMRLLWAAGTAVTVFIMLWGCSRPSSGCTSDADCKGDRICSAGKCIKPADAGASSRKQNPRNTTSQPSGQSSVISPGFPPLPSAPQVPPQPQVQNDPMIQMLQTQINMMLQSMGNLTTSIGSKSVNLRITGIGPNGEMYAKVCIDKKCMDLDLSKPDDVQKLFSHISSGLNDPFLRSYIMMMNQMIAQMRSGQMTQGQPSLPSLPQVQIPSLPQPSQPGPANPVPSSMGSSASVQPYHSWDAIQAARNAAKGSKAEISGLSVHSVSYPTVEFRDQAGHVYQLTIPESSRDLIPRLAKALKPVTVVFTISLVTPKAVRGTIESVSF